MQGLKQTAEQLGAKVLDYRLLDITSSPYARALFNDKFRVLIGSILGSKKNYALIDASTFCESA
jgi:hypothetical protein